MIFAVASLNKHWGEVVALFLMSRLLMHGSTWETRPTRSCGGGVEQACGYNFPRQGSWMAERDFAARKAEEKEKEAITYRPL